MVIEFDLTRPENGFILLLENKKFGVKGKPFVRMGHKAKGPSGNLGSQLSSI
jgi:hypothetical protein